MKKVLLVISWVLIIVSSMLFVKAYQSHTLVQIEDANGNNLNTILAGKMVKLESAVSCTEGYLRGLDTNNNPICEVPTYFFVPSSITKTSATHTGSTVGGYSGMNAKCGSDKHGCNALELTRRDQEYSDVGGSLYDYPRIINTGVAMDDGNTEYSDCKGFTLSHSSKRLNGWYKSPNGGTYFPNRNNCNRASEILCCSDTAA